MLRFNVMDGEGLDNVSFDGTVNLRLSCQNSQLFLDLLMKFMTFFITYWQNLWFSLPNNLICDFLVTLINSVTVRNVACEGGDFTIFNENTAILPWNLAPEK